MKSKSSSSSSSAPRIVSREAWLAARRQHLAQEKEFTRRRDELSRERRELPWVKVEQDYVFTGPKGARRLSELFEGCSQLIVYHFMFGSGWEEGCRGCSYVADHFAGMLPHLRARDVALVAVSQAPLAEFQPFRRRMGWKFPWLSAHGSTFNRDFGVSWTPQEIEAGKVDYNYGLREVPMEEMPGLSVFIRNEAGEIFHTYSTYSRGLDLLLGTYNYLDLVPKGRDEEELEQSMQWVRHHDRYEAKTAAG
jgi:predicted dithiol-disulfide oxidoreductase (DUF899 family)